MISYTITLLAQENNKSGDCRTEKIKPVAGRLGLELTTFARQ